MMLIFFKPWFFEEVVEPAFSSTPIFPEKPAPVIQQALQNRQSVDGQEKPSTVLL